jgi:GT2 family glycosyltransferase
MKVAAVVVTFNRLDLLKECIESLREQNHKIDNIYVVNNGSNDGTSDWLLNQSGLIVLNESNLGSSNGFFVGIKKAYDDGNDWIWCLDDDTIANQDALGKLMESNKISNPSTGFICSVVNWIDGELHKMNVVMPLTNKYNIYKNIIEDNSVEVNGASFVSLLLSRNAIKDCGLPIKEFFIWGDDAEYTSRISKQFKCFLKIDSIVVHKTIKNETADYSLMNKTNFIKYKYLIRNHIWFLRNARKKNNFFLNIIEHLRAFYTISKFSIRNKLFIKSMKSLISGYFFNPVVIKKY